MRKEERTRKRLIVVVMVAVAVCAVSVLVAVAAGECYTDVRISGTGNAWVDGYHPHHYMQYGRPEFESWTWSGTRAISVSIVVSGGDWICQVSVWQFTDPQNPWATITGQVQYVFANTSDSATPPKTGWTLAYSHEEGVHYPFVVSPPTMSGGEPCPPPLSFVITGLGPEGALLDQPLDLAEGEDPPMVGLSPLAAIYDVGDLVTGACSIDDEAGRTVRGTGIHVYIYSVDIEPRPEVVTLLDHWTVNQYDSVRGGYGYSWDTSGYAPGYYDVHLSFADGTSHTCRTQLTAPTE
ncbi:hypothetical protein ACFLSG_02960 [Candidatus Bipolaricaulota bacterium]